MVICLKLFGLFGICSSLRGFWGEVGLVSSDRKRGNGPKVCQGGSGWILEMDFSTGRGVRPWKNFPHGISGVAVSGSAQDVALGDNF